MILLLRKSEFGEEFQKFHDQYQDQPYGAMVMTLE